MRIVGFVYLLQCKDGSYYVGSHRGEDPAYRVWEHNAGVHKHAYTFMRRPVELVWCDYFYRYDEMVAVERQIKGWSRAKKEALIREDGGALRALSKRGVRPSLVARPSRRPFGPPQDEGESELKNLGGRHKHHPHPEEPAEGWHREGWAARRGVRV